MTSSGGHPEQKRHSEDIENPLAIVVEAFTPLTMPQFWPPDSLDYRSEQILPVAYIFVPKLFGPSWVGDVLAR